MNNLKKEIHAYIENYVSTMLDAWQCTDCNVTVEDFFKEFSHQFTEMCNKLAQELKEE